MGERIVIAGMGAATAVGRGAWESAAAVRAGISGFTQHPYMIDTAGEPMRVALAPWLDIALQGVERFEALLMPAVEEALASLGPPQTAPRRWAIALALPTPRPGLVIRQCCGVRCWARCRAARRARGTGETARWPA